MPVSREALTPLAKACSALASVPSLAGVGAEHLHGHQGYRLRVS